MLVKRTKRGLTHWVKTLAPNGFIAELTAFKHQACDLNQDQLGLMGKFYQTKDPELVGKFEVEKTNVADVPLPPPPPPKPVINPIVIKPVEIKDSPVAPFKPEEEDAPKG